MLTRTVLKHADVQHVNQFSLADLHTVHMNVSTKYHDDPLDSC